MYVRMCTHTCTSIHMYTYAQMRALKVFLAFYLGLIVINILICLYAFQSFSRYMAFGNLGVYMLVCFEIGRVAFVLSEVLLPYPLECWDSRYTPLYLAYFILIICFCQRKRLCLEVWVPWGSGFCLLPGLQTPFDF